MLVLDFDAEERYLVKKVGCPSIVAHDYMLVQECFYEKSGLLVYGDEEPESDPANAPVIDDCEKCEYISRMTGIDQDLCEQLSLADLDYLSEHGIAVEVPEYDELDRVVGRLNPRQRGEVLMMIQKMYHIK